MSTKHGPFERWQLYHSKKQGHYACIAGFEEDLRHYHETLAEEYDKMDLCARIALFGLVCGLIEEAEEGMKP